MHYTELTEADLNQNIDFPCGSDTPALLRSLAHFTRHKKIDNVIFENLAYIKRASPSAFVFYLFAFLLRAYRKFHFNYYLWNELLVDFICAFEQYVLVTGNVR